MQTPDMNPPGMPVGGGRRRGKGRKHDMEFQSYYGRPVLKRAHWGWEVWTYFFIGGMAAGAEIVTATSRLFGDGGASDRRIGRAGHYISFAGLVVSPVLLIMDLKRPERFLHMLRILKVRSPLSIGTYILITNSLLAGLTAAKQTVRDGIFSARSFPGNITTLYPDEPLVAAQGVAATALGSYTGVVLAATASPLWSRMMPVMGPLFLASGVSAGSAAIELTLALTTGEHEDFERLDRLELVAMTAELGLLATAYTRLLPPEVVNPALKSTWGKLFIRGTLVSGLTVPLLIKLLALVTGKSSRLTTIITALMVLAGSFLLRLTIIEAGKESADDPDAYHAITRGEARPDQPDPNAIVQGDAITVTTVAE